MTNASLGLNDIRRIDDDDVEEENYGRCESPVLSKILRRSQRSVKEMTPDDPELVAAAGKAVTPLLATPQSQTAHDLAATVPVEQSAIIPSFSIEANLVPSTAKIPESLCDLLNFENTSWTSSLATPHGRNVTYSNLNTEEKKVLVSSKPVPRTLFTPEVKEEQSQKSLNDSFMECSGILPSAEPKKLCKGYKAFFTSEIFSSNDASQNTTVLTGVEKYSDISLGCSTSAKEPRLVREVLDLLVSPVTTSRQKTYSEAESLSETPSHSTNYKYDHEFGKLSKLRPKAKRLFCKGNEPCSARESDTTVNGDQINNDTDAPTVDKKSKEQPFSPNLSDTFIFASPVSPVFKAKADEKQQKGDSMSCSPVLHKTQEFLHDLSFSTLEEVCQASEVLASGCNSPVENCEISVNFPSQKREPYTVQTVSPIQFEDLACHSSGLVLNKTSTPIHTERNKKAWANKKKIKFLNVHQGQKNDSSVKEQEEKLHFLCKPQVTSQKSDVVEQISKYDSDLQHSDTSVNKNSCVELNTIRPGSTESLRHRVVSVKSSAKQNKKFAYFSELNTCNTVNITRFPSVDAVLSKMLQSAEALEAVSLLQDEKNSPSLKKHLEQKCRTETDFVPFNKLSLASADQQSTAGNFVNSYNSLKEVNISEEESKINLDNVLYETVGDHTITLGRKRKSGCHGSLGDHGIAKRSCIKELKSVQVADVFKRPDSNYLQPYVSDTQLNVVFDNVEAIVAQSNSNCNIFGTVDRSCNMQNLSNFHAKNKCLSSLLEDINAVPSENYVDKENFRAERSNLSYGKSRTEFLNMDKNETYLLENPTELKTQNHYNLECNLPDLETSSESSRNLDNKLKKETDASEKISLDRGSTKTVSITQQSNVKQALPKVCKFKCYEMEEFHSEEPVTEAFNETSFLNSHQHIFDSSFTAVTQKATKLVGKEQTKEEALLGCEQNITFEYNITDETRKESLVIASAQNLLQNTNEVEDTANKGKAAECTPYTEFNKKGLLAFSCDNHYERLPSTEKCLQPQPAGAVLSVDNAEKGLCAQSNILDIKVFDGTDHGMFFTTAKGKKIETSKKCLDLAHNLFRDIIETNIEQLDGQEKYSTQEKGKTKAVTINEGDLAKLKVSENNNTKNPRENYEINDSSELQDSRMDSLNIVNRSATDAVPLQVGFSTASGKKFTVSEKSLHKARHIFQTVMELETTGDNTPLKDYDLFSIRDIDATPSSNTNSQRCDILLENTTNLSEQLQKKVKGGASEQLQKKVKNGTDACSNGKILGHARVRQTLLSKDRGICVTVDSNSSMLQKQMDETKTHSVKLETKQSTVGNDELKDRIISESLLEIDSANTNNTEFDVKSETVESGFTATAGGRILDKSLHKAKKICPDIVLQHSSENKDCNTSIENLTENTYEGNHEFDYTTFSDDKGPLPKTSSHKIVQAVLDVEGSDKLLNSECDALCAATVLMDSCTLTESLLEDTKTTFMTHAESDVTLSQAFIKMDGNCCRSQTEVANAEVSKGSGSNLNLGFMTAAGRNVTVSAASLDRAKSLLSDISVLNEDDCKKNVVQVKGRALNDSLMPQEKHNHYILKKGHVKKVNTVMQGEHSEELKSGRKVSLSGRDLIESVNKLTLPENLEQTNMKSNKCLENIFTVPEQVARNPLNCGFKTAAGKPLEISLSSLSKVGKIFDDIMIPDTKGQDYTAESQRRKKNEQFKESEKNSETISPLVERNIGEHDKFMTTLDTNVIERKLGTNFSPGKNDTFSFVTASGRNVDISQLSLQEVKESVTACQTSLDKVKEPLFNNAIFTEQTSSVESESEIKTLDKKGNSVCHKISKMCGGFVTAGGKQVDVSEESLMRVRNLFSDITENIEGSTLTVANMNEKEGIKGSSFKGKNVISPRKMKNSSHDRTIEMKKISSSVSKNESQIYHNRKNSMDFKRPNVCGGFVAAGGKNVDVSEESLMKVRNLFSDVTENVEETTLTAENMKGKKEIEGSSFKGKNVISPKKMKNSSQDRTIEMKKISSTESKNESQIYHNRKNSMDFKRLNECGGFVTAGGKKVDVSEESLMKVRNLFSDTTENVEETTLTTENMKGKKAVEGFSFKEKNVISPKKMKNSSQDRTIEVKKISSTESKNESQIYHNRKNSMDFKRLNVCGGFVTAGGKKVDISEESLMKVRNLFSDITENVEEATLNAGNMKEKEPIEMYSCKGTDNVSMEKVRAIEERTVTMEKISDTESENVVQITVKKKNSPNCKTLNMSVGFTTAGGKKINVSEESLARVKNLFSDTSENVENNLLAVDNMKLKGTLEIYSSSKKDIKSTEQVNNLSPIRSIRASKISDGEFQNKEKWLDKKEKSVHFEKLNMFDGFVTGGGRKVGVSEESLTRARNLFSDITENVTENTLTVENMEEEAAAECQCLENKKVLSLEAVEKPLADQTTATKKVLDSESDSRVKSFGDIQNVVDGQRLKKYGGFVTGCGKKVEVSEESLAKVRNLFSDITDNEENSSVVSNNEDSTSTDMKKSCITATDWLHNEFVDKETHLHTLYQESTAKGSRESDLKNCVSDTCTSNKPHGNALGEKVLQHNAKINVTSKSIFQKHEPTLTQVVSESTAALLLDDDFKKELEESDSSCFSMLTERSCSPDLSVANEREPGSPVIGSKNKCSRANKVFTHRNTTAKRAERITASMKNVCDQSKMEDKNNTPSFVPEVNSRRKRCSSTKDNQIHKKQRMSNIGLNENVGESPTAKIKAQVIPSPGIWLQLRMSDQKQCVQWRDMSNGNPPPQFTESELLQCGVRKSVINVTSTTAEFFKFSSSDFYREGNCQSLQAGEDTSLEFDADGFAGVQQVEKAFLSNPNVDKSLIPAGWIRNHYRWIVWKLAATERSFPHIYAARYLTPRVLLLQLKYRYDREIDRCQRPALRRIMEHDDTPGKRMVLCVADVIKHEETQEENGKEGSRQCLKMCNYELELTDGWYSIRCTVDKEMCHLIEAGRVAIGTKLVTHSAELVNCEQPCPPLEVGPSVRLKIHTNSTRRARWDCRLGYCRQPGPLPVCLTSLKPAGGIISCVTAVIARVYPIVYMEKGPDGKAEFYSAKQEALRASKRERQWQEHIEKLYSQERAQLSQIEWFSTCSQQSKPKGMSKKHVTTPTRQQLAAATCAEDLCQLLCNAPDPASLQSLLTEEQRDAVANYQQMRQQQLLQELEARVRKRIEEERNVTSSLALLKVRCLDAKECSARSAVLSIWRPSEDLLTLFQEGSVLKLFSITANGLRNGDLQLSACRQSRYQPQSCQPPKDFPARCVTPLSQVSSGNLNVPFGELDCVGVVVHVAPLSGNYQTVYLADADMDIVGISFWNGLKGSGWEDILQQKALVACSNLQSRVGAAVHWIPTTYATEFSIFSQHPRQKHLIEALESLRRNLNMDIDNFSYTCEGIVLSFLNEQIVTPVRNASLNIRQTKPSTADLSRLNSPCVTPELSEKVQRRLFKLEQYGEPPSLSPLALIPRSRVLKKSFQVPLKADHTAESSCDDSPPMSLDSDDT